MTKIISKFEQHREDFEFCAAITKRSSTTFYVAFSKLPLERAWSIYAVYAFCRTADDLVDVHHDSVGLLSLRHDLSDFASGHIPDKPIWRALSVVFDTYDMNLDAFFDMIRGQEQDINFKQPENQKDLEKYCYYVAGSVGLMILPMLSQNHHKIITPAIDLGIAMQLTNILRDVGEDYQQGRVYLPRKLLLRDQINLNDLNSTVPSKKLIKLWNEEAEIAISKYKSGLSMMPQIDLLARPSLLAATFLYRELLTVAREQNYPILKKRVFLTPQRRKTVLKEISKYSF